MTCGSVVSSNLGSGPVDVFSDNVLARAQGWYGMSSSFPLFLPPMSERLRLWPIPPRARSGPQPPDRSGIFVDPLWLPAAGACARTVGEKDVSAISAATD